MYTTWEYNNPVRLVFGAGCLAALPTLVQGRRTLLVTTAGFTARGVTKQVRELLEPSRIDVLDTVQPNPDLYDLEHDCEPFLENPPEVVIGLGGGSALDTAKAMSFLMSSGTAGILRQHFQHGAALPDVTPRPLIAVPTTAGTGSEVTPFATIWDKQHQKKYSLARPNLYAEVALLDPTLSVSLPRDVTVATGLDALSQAFEAIWNRNATPITSLFAQRAIAIVFDVLPRLVDRLDDLQLRSSMMEASLLAGLAISKTRTAIAHSMSYPITAHYGVPHGLACSFTLPTILEFNAVGDDGRLEQLAKQLNFGSVTALRDHLEQLLVGLDIDKLVHSYVSKPESLVELAGEMLTPGRSDNSLRAVTTNDVEMIVIKTNQMYFGR